MGVQATAADHVTSRRREQDAPKARQQRTGQQNGSADALGECAGGTDLVDAAGIHGDGVGRVPGHVRPQGVKDFRQRLDVLDARDVFQGDGLGPQKGGGEGGKSCVLIAGGPYAPLEGMAAFDKEVCH